VTSSAIILARACLRPTLTARFEPGPKSAKETGKIQPVGAITHEVMRITRSFNWLSYPGKLKDIVKNLAFFFDTLIR
jgi:hypothetical protein